MSPIEHLARFGGAQMRGGDGAAAAGSSGDVSDFGATGCLSHWRPSPAASGHDWSWRLVAARPNLLLLDEPTNHLDLEMRHALGMALQDYPGALVVVSHDRHLIRSIADDLWMVAAGRVASFDGDLDDYARALFESRSTIADNVPEGPTPAEQRRAQRRAEAEHRNRLEPAARWKYGVSKRRSGRLELEQAEIERMLSDPVTYDAKARPALTQTLARQRTIRSRLDELEARWLAVSEALQRRARRVERSWAGAGDGKSIQCAPMSAVPRLDESTVIHGDAIPPRHRRRRWRRAPLLVLLLIWAGFALWHLLKSMPPGTNLASDWIDTPLTDVRWLADSTVTDGNGRLVVRQHIFDEALSIIAAARDLVVVDFYLFNDWPDVAGHRRGQPCGFARGPSAYQQRTHHPTHRKT